MIGAGRDGDDYLGALAIFLNLFQHGGCPLEHLTEEDYRAVIRAFHDCLWRVASPPCGRRG
jgi:hypothetical protein